MLGTSASVREVEYASPAEGECFGLTPLRRYGRREQLPWARVLASDSKTPVPGKMLLLGFVRAEESPFAADAGLAAGADAASSADSQDNSTTTSTTTTPAPVTTTPAPAEDPAARFVSESLPAWLSSARGSVDIAAVQLLMHTGVFGKLRPVLMVDNVRRALSVTVALSGNASVVAGTCGFAPCALIEPTALPIGAVTAGEPISPPLAARLHAADGGALAGRVVCFASGRFADLDRLTGDGAIAADAAIAALAADAATAGSAATAAEEAAAAAAAAAAVAAADAAAAAVAMAACNASAANASDATPCDAAASAVAASSSATAEAAAAAAAATAATAAAVSALRVVGARLPAHCNISAPDGGVLLRGVVPRSDAAAASGAEGAVWGRFYGLNAAGAAHTSCLAALGVWLPACRSAAVPLLVRNRVARIAVPGAVAVAGRLSLELAANGTRGAEQTLAAVPLQCLDAYSGAVACRDVTVRAKAYWGGADAPPPVLASFSENSDGSAAQLALALGSPLAGEYELELDAHGARQPLFVRVRYAAAARLRLLPDTFAVVWGSYSNCSWDCGAMRNASQVGRRHVQNVRVQVAPPPLFNPSPYRPEYCSVRVVALQTPLRVQVEDAVGAIVWGAQARAELVPVSEGAAGQLSGAVSAPQAPAAERERDRYGYSAHLREWEFLPTAAAARFPALSVRAALPGTYRLRVSLFGPAPLAPGAAAPAPLLLDPFRVWDRVEVSVARDPPPALVSGANAPGPAPSLAPRGATTAVLQAQLHIRRAANHSAVAFAPAWEPPAVRVELVSLDATANESGSIFVRNASTLRMPLVPVHTRPARLPRPAAPPPRPRGLTRRAAPLRRPARWGRWGSAQALRLLRWSTLHRRLSVRSRPFRRCDSRSPQDSTASPCLPWAPRQPPPRTSRTRAWSPPTPARCQTRRGCAQSPSR